MNSNTMTELHQPMDLHIGAILRNAPRFQRERPWRDIDPTSEHQSHHKLTLENVQKFSPEDFEGAAASEVEKMATELGFNHTDPQAGDNAQLRRVTAQKSRDNLAPENDGHELLSDEPQTSQHAQMMEELKLIATGIEEMGLHIHILNKPDMPAKESRQCRELLTNLFHQTKEDFWGFLGAFHKLESQLAPEGDKTKQELAASDQNFSQDITTRPKLTTNNIQSIEIVPSPEPERKLRSPPKPKKPTALSATQTDAADFPKMSQNGTQTVVAASEFDTFLTALPGTIPPPSTIGDRDSTAPVHRHPAYIGSDAISKAIIERDTEHVTKHFSQIMSGSFRKTGLELGVIEVDGEDWIDEFCETHQYLNGILMAITAPKELFLWHTKHFPVESDTWTKGALVRTMSIVTESPRHLHTYPLRQGRNLPPGKPSLLLHWNLEDVREPHVSARFKELVQVGNELENRVGAFNYKQMIVCITIPWWICDKDTTGDQKKAMMFLERMGIVGAVPVNEKTNGKVEETLWCASRIKVGGSDQSVHAFLQETTFTGSPEMEPEVAATPTPFVVVTVRKGQVHDWVDAVQFSLGMNSNRLRYPIVTEEPIDLNHLEKFYRSGGRPGTNPSKEVTR
ncbi:hypothetical protein AK830_g2795 [Neonectria ditissima]|uniref:Uncharacterized protein n=1 Tax=Neonectria ditissima TaxID=78410 RepID=A0A0P7BTX8_9HYPO|nr:hypothetical protein AK830_g2795 [Neonectria ditissima]